MNKPAFSVVVPAYNENSIIGESLGVIAGYLQETGLTYELLVVDDGSTDNTVEMVEAFRNTNPNVRLIRMGKNQGKGAAVRRGVQEARGEVISFTDADLPYRVQNLGDVIALVQSGVTDIAIGARDLKTSESDPSYPWIRKFMGRSFSLIVQALLVPRIPDTQCGLKAFSGSAAKLLFAESKINSFGFDFEILFLANKYGFRVERVPVTMSHRHESKVRLIRDSAKMLHDVIRVRRINRQMGYRAAPRCPVCFSAEVWSLAQIGGWVVRQCKRCHGRYLNVFPSTEELEKLYDKDYYSSSDGLSRGYESREMSVANERTAQRRAALLRRQVPAQARVLEVGAGNGLLGRVLASEFEYVGIDLCEPAVREARSSGLNILRASLGDYVNTEMPFDALTLFHVFEHLPDPHDALGKISELLKPGGTLVIITPDTESLLCAVSGDRWVSYKFPEHLILYSRSGLIELLERSGFEIVDASSDYEYCDHDFVVSRLEKLSPALASVARVVLKPLPNPLPVTSGSICIVAKRRAGSPSNMRAIRAIEPTHAR
ncbi:MAG TPA: glycosyltransferase [Thermoanaerobaculia bacterium]|nr:glycosyltransferase [Thermoanaerobaculia bacterium]